MCYVCVYVFKLLNDREHAQGLITCLLLLDLSNEVFMPIMQYIRTVKTDSIKLS